MFVIDIVDADLQPHCHKVLWLAHRYKKIIDIANSPNFCTKWVLQLQALILLQINGFIRVGIIYFLLNNNLKNSN